MVDATETVGTFHDLSSNLARWYRTRLKYLVVTALNQGAGFLVMYTLLVLAGGVLLREALVLRDADRDRLKRFTESSHMARDDDQYVTSSALVLSELSADDRLSATECPAHSDDCTVAMHVLDLTVNLAQLVDQSEVEKRAGPDDEDLRALLHRFQVPEIALGPVKAAVASMSKDTTSPSLPVESFPCLSSADLARNQPRDERRRAFELELARCVKEATDLSALQIPEQTILPPLLQPGGSHEDDAANQESGSGIDQRPGRPGPRANHRVNKAIVRSYALEAALRAYSAELERLRNATHCSLGSSSDCTEGETRTFTAAYFISVDSVFRIWTAASREQPLTGLPTNRLWAARAYFAHYLDEKTSIDDVYVSPPYIDFAGAGVVQTLCRPVALLPQASGTTTASREISGVVCADLALREKALSSLVTQLDSGPLVAAELVRLQRDCQPAPNQPAAARLHNLITSLDWRTNVGSKCIDDSVWRTVTPIQYGSNTWYLIPIGRAGDSHLVIALTPTSNSGIGRLFRWLILGAIGSAAAVVLTLSAWQSRRLSMSERELARLRGLPAPAIETVPTTTSPSGTIMFANDRAEELLQVQLQKFGSKGGGRVDIWRVFDDERLVLSGLNGEPVEGPCNATTIERDRRRGDTTAYYAPFRDPSKLYFIPETASQDDPSTGRPAEITIEWIKLVCGPVVLPRWTLNRKDARGHLEATFGVLTPVLDERTKHAITAVLDARATASNPATRKGT